MTLYYYIPIDWHSFGGGGGVDPARRPGSMTSSNKRDGSCACGKGLENNLRHGNNIAKRWFVSGATYR